MNLIWHIVRKDLRGLGPLLAAWWVLLLAKAAYPALAFHWALRQSGPQLEKIPLYSWILAGCATILLIVLVAELFVADAPLGDRAFWRTRPITTGKLLAAKVVFLGLFCLGLPGLIGAVARLCFGFTGAQSLQALAWFAVAQVGWMLLALLMTVLARRAINGLVAGIVLAVLGAPGIIIANSTHSIFAGRFSLGYWFFDGEWILVTALAVLSGLTMVVFFSRSRPKFRLFIVLAGLLGTGLILVFCTTEYGNNDAVSVETTRRWFALGMAVVTGAWVTAEVYQSHARRLAFLYLACGLGLVVFLLAYWPFHLRFKAAPVEKLAVPLVSLPSRYYESIRSLDNPPPDLLEEWKDRVSFAVLIDAKHSVASSWSGNTIWRAESVDIDFSGAEKLPIVAPRNHRWPYFFVQQEYIPGAYSTLAKMSSAKFPALEGFFRDPELEPVAHSNLFMEPKLDFSKPWRGKVILSHGPLVEIARVKVQAGAVSTGGMVELGLVQVKYSATNASNLVVDYIERQPAAPPAALFPRSAWRQTVVYNVLVNPGRREAFLSGKDFLSYDDYLPTGDLALTRGSLEFNVGATWRGEQTMGEDDVKAWLADAYLVRFRYEPAGLVEGSFTIDEATLKKTGKTP